MVLSPWQQRFLDQLIARRADGTFVHTHTTIALGRPYGRRDVCAEAADRLIDLMNVVPTTGGA